MSIYLVNVEEKARLQTSYLIDLDGEFDDEKAVQIIAAGGGEQFDSTYQGNTGEMQVLSHTPFGLKALKVFREKIKPFVEAEKQKQAAGINTKDAPTKSKKG